MKRTLAITAAILAAAVLLHAAEPDSATATRKLQLSVKEPWPFSMKVTKGQTLQITAAGKWRILPRGKQHGPNAEKFYFQGRLGEGKPFKIGAKFTLRVEEDSVLRLGIREGGNYDNNSGKVLVTIQVQGSGAGPAAAAVPPKPATPLTEEAKYYQTVSAAYMDSDWTALAEQLKLYAKYVSRLSDDQRTDLDYIRKEATAHPPSWWKSTASSRNITFTAKIWGRSFKANYIPSGMLGAQGVAEIRDGRLMIVVTWQPQLIDNPDPVEGKRAKVHKLTKGDFAESIVWHELGHNYVTEFLPAKQVIELYNNYYMMFGQLQEFFADMTSLYHARPKARKCILFMRLPSLVMYDENDPHVRAAYGIGSILLNEWLSDPENVDKAWPHIHLPATMPDKDIERNVLAYVYYHWDPKFSVSEDIRFRELIKSSLTTKKPGQRYTEGERILRSKGTIELADGLQFKLMPGEDRPLKLKRDAWVKQQLTKAIQAGKTDTKAQAKKIAPWELISSPEIRSLIGGGM